MKHAPLFLLATLIVLTAAKRASTQNAAAPHPATESSVLGPAGSTIAPQAHAPFSARLVEQRDQTLDDGTHISRSNDEIVMRDGMGRIYRAHRIKRPGDDSDSGMLVTVIDPVQKVQYFCTPVRKRCTKLDYRPLTTTHRLPHPGNRRDLTFEDLGRSVIRGLEVEGGRVTRVFPAGELGNDRPLTTIREVWHSTDLDVDVEIKQTDPRIGTLTTTMTEVSLAEPDSKYFQIPEGYRVEERKQSPMALVPRAAAPDPAYLPGLAPNQ